MRLATLASPSGSRWVVFSENAYYDLSQVDSTLPQTLKELLASPGGLEQAEADLQTALAQKNAPVKENDIAFLAPVPNPEKIICIGMNYADHAAEQGAEVPAIPVVFNKFPTAARGHGQSIDLPPISDKVDYEAELVVVIGKGGHNIPQESALSHVAGYACGHDVSARDWQVEKPGKQWLLGKTFDTFAPVGPHLVTADEVSDPHNLAITLRLNGQTMQQSNTRQLIFRIDTLIAHISQFCTLRPGDMLFTGTPSGVGMHRDPRVFLKPGDTVEVEIEGLGILQNPVRAATE